MELDFWRIASLGLGALVIFASLLKVTSRIVRYWPKNRKAAAPATTNSKGDSVPFFSASVIALTITFGALLLLTVNSQQTSPSSRALSFLTAGVAALNLIGVLLLVFGVPAYKFTMNLKEAYQGLEEKVKALAVQNQRLEESVEALKAQIQTVSPAQQLPIQRKPSVRRKQRPQAHSRRNSSKAGKADMED